MTQPRRTNSYSREPEIDGLDSSSAWIGDEDAIIPPVALEPYDMTLEDDTTPYTQVIPIPRPVRDSWVRSLRGKRSSESPETSVLIPVGKANTVQPVRKNIVQPQPLPAITPPAIQTAPQQFEESERVTRGLPRPRRMVSSVLLLLLSVMAIFIFAYIAQK